MAINYKNVVSIQTHTGANGITAGISGFTLSNHGVSGHMVMLLVLHQLTLSNTGGLC
jgi:hypothetical protein